MKRKILGVVLSLTMLCSLAACGKDEVQKESVSNGFVSSETAKTTESKEDIKEEPVTLTMGIFDRGRLQRILKTARKRSVYDQSRGHENARLFA